MEKDIAIKLKGLVGNLEKNFFEEYSKWRVSHLYKQLESLSDINEIFKVQGQIKEVKRLLTLKEEIASALNNKEN